MALALLDLLDFDEAGYDLQVDIGTNTHFEIRIGEQAQRRAGTMFVEAVFQNQPLRASEGQGDPLAPPEHVRIAAIAGPGRAYAQLFSYKAGKRSPAVSDLVELPSLAGIRPRRRRAYTATLSVAERPVNAPASKGVRAIACRDVGVAQPMSFDTILAEVLRIAQPIVAEVLKSAVGGAGGGIGTGDGSGTGGGAMAAGGAGDLISGLLKAVLAAAPAIGGAAPLPQVARPQSLKEGNRFALAQAMAYSQPQFYEQIIAAAIGPLIQALPQLANAANQRDKDQRASADALTGTIVKEINQRLLMERVMEAQRQAAAGGGGAAMPSAEDLARLAAMVGQLPAPPANAAPVATPQSILRDKARAPYSAKPSARAILEPVVPAALAWSGGNDPLYQRSERVVLRFRFIVAPPLPTAPLPKAILKVVLADDSRPALRYEKRVRFTGLTPNMELECPFEPGEISHLLSGSRLTATATLCWPGRSGTTEALGSTKLVLVGPMFVKARGNEVGSERELTDMRRWRQFWNKVWEAPTLAGDGDNAKRRWKIDADVRYAVVLGTDPRNGLMETRHRPGKADPDSDYAMTEGKLKAGAELTIPQLAALRALWELPELPAETVTALSDQAFLAQSGGDVVRRITMKGRAGERGLVWMVPTFRLVDIQLSRVKERGVAGDVTAVEDVVVQLPLPAALRVLAMKSA